MSGDVVVIFSGGGSLGAYSCGVWQSLASAFADSRARLVGVAGVSIGAIHAGLVARHGQDVEASARALEALWTERLAVAPTPFVPLTVDREDRSWNGLLTGLLVGNPRLYHPAWPRWQPLAGLHRRKGPLMDRSAMWRLLEDEIVPPEWPAGGPWLGVGAVDVLSGDLRLFHSDETPLQAAHLAASSAIPVCFDPVEIDDRVYWDGDMTHDSLLDPVLTHLQRSGRLAPEGKGLTVITVEHAPKQAAALPEAGLACLNRAMDLFMQGKLARPLPAGLSRARSIHIRRSPLPHDGISGHFDYSPERISELMALGREEGQAAMAGWAR
ncbi:hypothetical protein GTZ97_11815 [Aquabacterium fontiphilum]|uniref:patatin-like phospholipase family protein n=1 Tax=Aquabacterium fontiphilum TaxID=450365 RepID=UPI0013766A8D|nr:patatin-like phospholipase family protein [Aquabacterium fontiphilum]NBD21350.1 hypothetical protein [Aquabacterium fontiphilum]